MAVIALIAPSLRPAKELDTVMLDALLQEPKAYKNEFKNLKPKNDLIIPQANQPQPLMLIRVLLESNTKQATIGAEGPWQLQSKAGLLWREGNGIAAISCVNQQLQLLNSNAPDELWLRPTSTGIANLNSSNYRGELRLYCNQNGLVVVNHIPLEQYIASVVGAEMPSYWPDEALRAQAVAARSYALAHMARPADPDWNLGATTRWQVYQGLASETGPARAAADFTRGLVLSYQGELLRVFMPLIKRLALKPMAIWEQV
ncbi:SpoIID/LytB domain-containing protein [Synechococcus lacustris Tous-12m]